MTKKQLQEKLDRSFLYQLESIIECHEKGYEASFETETDELNGFIWGLRYADLLSREDTITLSLSVQRMQSRMRRERFLQSIYATTNKN